MDALELVGHANVTTLAGSASLTIHRHIGPLCIPFMTLLLDPAEVAAMHAELGKALAPARPRMRVEQDPRNGLWRIDCPMHPDLPGRWIHQAGAMAGAYNHLHYSHQERL